MRNFYNTYLKRNTWFHVLTGLAFTLVVASFIVPPLGVIDDSVIRAVGEIFGFAALGTIIHCVDRGAEAKITHNDTSIEIYKQKD